VDSEIFSENHGGALTGVGADLRKSLLDCSAAFQSLAETAPEWFAYFEDVQACTASKEDILELLRASPNRFCMGLMYGIFIMRQELASMTGREFL